MSEEALTSFTIGLFDVQRVSLAGRSGIVIEVKK